jgi:hypothetical protein
MMQDAVREELRQNLAADPNAHWSDELKSQGGSIPDFGKFFMKS